jgi:ClpP class serine protease
VVNPIIVKRSATIVKEIVTTLRKLEKKENKSLKVLINEVSSQFITKIGK